MNPLNRAALVEAYIRQREALLAEFPELAEDVQALADTLEGETEAPDVIAGFIREAREDAAKADALGRIMSDMGERKARFVARAERRREAAQRIMVACGIRKIELADFTASIRNVPPSVIITDDAALPDSFCRFARSPDKTRIKDALGRGEEIPGAELTNGGETISIRVK